MHKPLKICLISSCYALDEQDRHASFLVESNRYLRGRNVEVSVFAPSYRGCPSHEIDGVPVHRFRYFWRRWENLTHKEGAATRVRNPFYVLIAGFYVLLGLVQAVWFCRGKGFDIIHVHWPFPHAIWGYVVSRMTGARMVITFHGAEVLLCQKLPLVRPFLRHAVRHADAVICNSSFTAERVRALGVTRPIEVIPFGSTVTIRPGAKEQDKAIREILFAGRLIERKGVEFLLRAAPRILEQEPAHFHIVGDGDLLPQLKQLARQLGIDQHVTFHGFVSNEELEHFYHQADVFVLPAIVDRRGDTEGLGVVLVEAISYRTPVVASQVGGIIDIVRHEQTGLLVPPGDPQALADGVLRVLSDRELAARLARQGLEHAQNYLNWQRITDRLMAIYSPPVTHQSAEAEEPSPPQAPAPLRASWGRLALRVLLSVAVLAVLFTQISIADVLQNLKRVSPAFVLFAWGYYALCQLLSSYRWQLLLKAKQVEVPLSKLFSFYMIGMFANSFLPGSVGGDVVKSYHLFRRTKDVKIAAVSVFLERFTGLVGLSLISVIALAVGYRHLDSPIVLWSVLIAVATLIGSVLILWKLPVLARRAAWLRRFFPEKLLNTSQGIYEALLSYRHHLPTVMAAVAVSAVLQFLFAAYYALASVAMGIPIDVIYFMLFLPLITLVSMIPISLGGLGLREAMMVALFGAVGISQTDVLSVSLTIHLINTLLSLWGGALLIRQSFNSRSKVSAGFNSAEFQPAGSGD